MENIKAMIKGKKLYLEIDLSAPSKQIKTKLGMKGVKATAGASGSPTASIAGYPDLALQVTLWDNSVLAQGIGGDEFDLPFKENGNVITEQPVASA